MEFCECSLIPYFDIILLDIRFVSLEIVSKRETSTQFPLLTFCQLHHYFVRFLARRKKGLKLHASWTKQCDEKSWKLLTRWENCSANFQSIGIVERFLKSVFGCWKCWRWTVIRHFFVNYRLQELRYWLAGDNYIVPPFVGSLNQFLPYLKCEWEVWEVKAEEKHSFSST